MIRAWAVAVALLLAAAAFANAIPGGFVGDDDVQIARNAYLSDPSQLWTALTSDVWGFARTAGEPASHYWRPVFVLWLVLNHALFGFAPAGWHLSSLALHAAVLLAAAAVLRRLEVRPAVGAAVLWTFATHPVHVEAVAWASGAPDLLLALFVLTGYAVHLSLRRRASFSRRVAAWGLFAAALLSKETAIAYPLFVAVGEWSMAERRSAAGRFAAAARAAVPYAVVAAGVLAARTALLGSAFGAAARTPPASWLPALPEALAFYLRQSLWPVSLSPLYPLRPVGLDAVDAARLAAAGIVVLAAAAAAALAWRRGTTYRVGIAAFAGFLAPVLVSLGQLEPERLVQDRYLYLPLWGLLLVVFQAAGDLAARLLPPERAERALVACGLALALLCGGMTVRYNRVWRDDIALWERAVRFNPDSVYSLGTLGFHYRVAGRAAEAREVLRRAERIDPAAPQVLLDLGILLADQGRLRQARKLLVRALDAAPDHETVPDHLGRVLLALGESDEAIELFSRTRERHPDLWLKTTINLAVACRAAGLDERAAQELGAVREQLERQDDPTLLLGLWHLGEVEADLGRVEAARADLRRFLERTTGRREVEGPRRLAARRLDELSAAHAP